MKPATTWPPCHPSPLARVVRDVLLGLALATFPMPPSAVTAQSSQTQSPFDVEGFVMETKELRELVPAGGTLRVSNLFGDLRFRKAGAPGTEAVAVATLQHFSEQPRLMVETRTLGPNVFIEVVAQQEELQGATASRRRADLVVFVPEQTTLHVKSGSGLVDVRNTMGDISVDTPSGDTKIRSVKGALQINAKDGDVTVYIDQPPPMTAQHLSTGSGDIRLHVNDEALLALNIETSGLIATDYSMEVSRAASPSQTTPSAMSERMRKTAQLAIGKPIGSMSLTSATGKVSVYRRLLERQAKQRTP